MTLTTGLLSMTQLKASNLTVQVTGSDYLTLSTLASVPQLNNLIAVFLVGSAFTVWLSLLFCYLSPVTSTQNSVETLLNEIENESGNIYDLQLPVESLSITFLTTLGFIFVLPIVSNYANSIVVFNTLFTIICLLTPPTVLTVIYSGFMFNYIKGAPTKNSLLTNVLLDGIALVAFFTRFLLQLLRYVLVLVKLALVSSFLNQLTTSGSHIKSTNSNQLLSENSVSGYFFTNLQTLVGSVAHYIFEMLETFLIYYAQTGALGIVVVWLLNALYSYSSPQNKVSWYGLRRPQ